MERPTGNMLRSAALGGLAGLAIGPAIEAAPALAATHPNRRPTEARMVHIAEELASLHLGTGYTEGGHMGIIPLSDGSVATVEYGGTPENPQSLYLALNSAPQPEQSAADITPVPPIPEEAVDVEGVGQALVATKEARVGNTQIFYQTTIDGKDSKTVVEEEQVPFGNGYRYQKLKQYHERGRKVARKALGAMLTAAQAMYEEIREDEIK